MFLQLSGNFTPLKMQDPELVNQLKERLPEALFEKLNGSLSIDRDRLRFAEYKVRVLEERLHLVRIEKYGPGSEKLSEAQLELLELEPGVSSAEVQAESEREQLQLPLKSARKHPGRQELPAELPRTEQIIACTAEQCVCGKCGKQTAVIGYETSEQLDVEPAKYFVRVTKREKRACKDPVLELSNNLAENAIRPVALGRKNWIHVGSKKAGPRVAAIISVVETCRRLKIPVRDYLGSVLPGLGDFPISRIAELTSAAWATRN
ncbi:MAG: transposase [Chthoniobacterales bacterium]